MGFVPLATMRNPLFWIFPAVALAACSKPIIVPDLPRNVPETWGQNESPGDSLPRPDLTNWWKAFDDATLDELIDTALSENLTVSIAGERLKAARQLHRRSRGDFLPNLNFRVYEETAPGGETGFLEMGFDTTWELGLFGRAEGNKRVNEADLGGALIDEAAVRISITAEVARTYVDLCSARARASIVARDVSIRKRQLELAQVRLRTHLGSQLEVERAGLDLQGALADETDAQIPIAEAQAALAFLLGKHTLDSALAPAHDPPRLPRLEIAQTPADLVRTRPEIRRAELNVLRAAGELGIARADLYPRFSIVGTLISSTALTGDLDSPNKAVPLLGPAITLPIFDWNARRAVVGAREAALDAAVLSYRETVLEGVAEVRTALARYHAKTDIVDHAKSSLDIAQTALAVTQNSRSFGLQDDGDVSAAKWAFEQARLSYVSALHERAVSYIALYKAFGGNLPEGTTS